MPVDLPQNSELERAQALLQAKRPAEAVAILADLVQREPDSATVHNACGVALAQLGRQDEAVAEFGRALELDAARTEEYLANRADAFFEFAQFDLAAADYATLLQLAPGRSRYVYQRGRCRFHLGDDPGAADDYCAAIVCFAEEQAANLTGENLLTYLYSMNLNTVKFLPKIWRTAAQIAEARLPHSFFCPLARGIVADHEENTDEAFRQLRAALQRDPTNARVHSALGSTLARVGRHEEAVTEFSRALDYDAEHGEVHLASRAEVLFEMRKFDRARCDFDRLMKLAPAKSAYAYWRGVCAFHLGDDDQAAADYCTALRRYVEHRDRALRAADILAQIDVWVIPVNTDEASATVWAFIAKLAEEKVPGSFVVPHAMGMVKYYERDAERAIDLLLSALQLSPESWWSARALAGIYMEQGNRRTAAGYFRKALHDAGDAATAELCLSAGWCFGKVNDTPREIDAYRRCVRAHPGYQFARNNLGWALLKAKRPEEAIPYLEASLRGATDGRAPIFNLAEAYQQTGRWSEAIEVLRLDKTEKGTLSKAAQRQIARIHALRSGEEALAPVACPQVPEADRDVPADAIEASAAEEGQQGKLKERLTAPGTSTRVRAYRVPFERLLEDLVEEKILRGDEVFGRYLTMYESPEGLYGRQFAAGGVGRVDLLAVDTSTGSLVVIELKRGEGAPEVLDQIAKYVAWGRTNLAKDGQSVHGIICVGRRCSALEAAARQRGFEVYEYDFRLVRRT